MPLNGKKCFCFVALKHHSRFLLPMTRVLEAEGVDIRYLTAPAEMPFELTLMEEGLPYTHPFSYLTPEVAEQTEAAYRQVRSAWREKAFTSSILHHFTLPIQDKTLRMQVENFYLFRQMFAQEKPDFVLALHELNSWGKMLGYLSHEYKIPCITLQEGLYYAPAGIYRFHTEYSTACLVWGEATREVLVRSGGSTDKIFAVGNTHLAAAIAQVTHPDVIQETKKELRLEHNKKVVTILMGGVGYQEGFAFPPEFVAWARETAECTIICKWHPVTNKTVIENIQEKFGDSAHLRFVQHYDTYRLLAVSDVCVVFGNSTTGLEALAFGKPLIEVWIPGLEYSFAAQGVAERVDSLAAVPTVVQQLFAGGVPLERAQKVSDYLSHNLAATLDGNSVERAVDVIAHLLAVQDEQRQPGQLVLTPPQQMSYKGISISAQLRQEGHTALVHSIGSEEKVLSSEDTQDEYLCSIIIPLQATAGIVETLIGIAMHTPSDISYECLLSSAQPDDVRQLLSDVQGDIRLLIASRTSVAHLCNVAARAAKARYLCFLPPGMVPQAGWLEALLKEMETESTVDPSEPLATGIVGGKALLTSGEVAHAGITFDANCSLSFLYRFLPTTFAGVNKTRTMPAVTGCILVSRDVYLSLNGMDEGFQCLWHEVDLCLQARLAGWQTKYTPHSVCLTLTQEEERNVGDRLRFYGKWVGNLWPNEGTYWQEDGLDNKMLQQLYQAHIS